MDKSKFSGTGVAVVTPFHSDLSVDYDSLGELIEFLITSGINYLVAMGTTGESPTISVSEKEKIFKFFVQRNKGRVPLIMGIGGNDTRAIQEALERVDPSGFDAILSVSPYYNRPTQEGIYQHYKALDKSTPLPLILYNVPGRTSSNITAETTLRIARDCPNVIGTKDASGNLKQGEDILTNRPDNFILLSGDDETAIPLIQCGAEGVISVIAGCFPRFFKEGVDAALDSNYQKADEVSKLAQPIIDLLFEEGNPAGVKSVLSQRGLIKNHLRLPLISVSESVHTHLSTYVKQYK